MTRKRRMRGGGWWPWPSKVKPAINSGNSESEVNQECKNQNDVCVENFKLAKSANQPANNQTMTSSPMTNTQLNASPTPTSGGRRRKSRRSKRRSRRSRR